MHIYGMATQLGNLLVDQLLEEATLRTSYKDPESVYAFIRGASQAYAEQGHVEVYNSHIRWAMARALDGAWQIAYGMPCDDVGFEPRSDAPEDPASVKGSYEERLTLAKKDLEGRPLQQDLLWWIDACSLWARVWSIDYGADSAIDEMPDFARLRRDLIAWLGGFIETWS